MIQLHEPLHLPFEIRLVRTCVARANRLSGGQQQIASGQDHQQEHDKQSTVIA